MVDHEKTLWERIRQGEMDAYTILYDEYVDDLYYFGLHYIKDEGFVKDCIHDLFLDIYMYREKLAKEINIKSYMFKAFKNILFKGQKKKLQLVNPNENEFMDIGGESVEMLIIDREDQEHYNKLVTKAFQKLGKKQKKVIKLRFEQNMNYKEISEALNISVESSRTLIYRAIKKMRQ